MSTQVYNATGGGLIGLFPNPIIANRNPTTTDTVSPTGQPYQVFQGWNNALTDDSFIYLGAGNWVTIASIVGGVTELTGNSGTALPVAGNINIVGGDTVNVTGSGSTLTIATTSDGYPITPFVVGPAGSAGYQTVQSAVTAANAAGGGIVYVQPGSYTENLTLFSNVQVVGTSDFRSAGGATIIGVHTPPTTGQFTFSNLKLQSATHIFSSAAAGSARLTVNNCNTVITTGYLFSLLNWTGILEVWDTDTEGSTNDGFVNNTGGATIYAYSSGVGAGSVNTASISGTMLSSESNFYCPLNFVTTSDFAIDFAIFNQMVTCSNASTGTISNSRMSTGAGTALTMSSSATVNLHVVIVDSGDTPVIDGAGAGDLILSAITFPQLNEVASTLKVSYSKFEGLLSPYTVGATGTYSSIQNIIDMLRVGVPGFGPHVIYLQPGLFAEDLDFTGFSYNANFHLRGVALNAKSSIDGTSLFGNITPPANAGRLLIEDINLVADTGDIISSVAAGQADIILRNCNSNTTGGGYIINLPNWTSGAEIIVEGHQESASGIACGGVVAGAAPVTIQDCISIGTTTGSAMTLTSATQIKNSKVNCPVTFGTGSNFTVTSSVFTQPITCSGSSTGTIQGSILTTGASAALTMSSSAAVAIENSVVTSSNNPAIAGAGAGVLTLGGVDFTSNTSTAGTLTLATSDVFKAGSLQSIGSVSAGTSVTATLGNITATAGNFVASLAGSGLVLPVGTASGGTPQIVNARVGSVTFTGVSIAAAADLTLTLTNSTITGASTRVILSMSGATTGSALSIKSITPSAGSLAIVVTNGTGATTTTADIVFDFIVLN